MSEQTITVDTPSKSYAVHVGCGVLARTGELVRASAGGNRAALICDSNVGPLYAHRILDSLAEAGYETTYLEFPAGERNKRLVTVEALLEGLAKARLTRRDVVVAAGGGVTGDMAGLAAALYLRGIAYAQVPTSLLAMVDSSVGGKTAVDLSVGKNLAGAFWQPCVVIADVKCLHTLSPALFRDSCGEIVKHAVLSDKAMLGELIERPLDPEARDDERMVRLVARNICIKRDVVTADERESGVRQTLNLGHTLGHAIEAASDYHLGHGSSVAAGLCCVARAGEALGWTQPGLARLIERACSAHNLPTTTELDPQTLMHYALHDKKSQGATVNLIVPEDVGKVQIRAVSTEELAEVTRLGCTTQDV